MPSREDSQLLALVDAIVAGDRALANRLLDASPSLATRAFLGGATRADATSNWIEAIAHYIYGGDTALHLAAAAYAKVLATKLITAGANVRARNRRGAEPIHYACDGGPNHHTWDPRTQAAMIQVLIEAGADPNATDKGGVAPLHRAVRTRCTGAVSALLAGGADPRQPNSSGTTPMQLATLTTGRGGSGSAESKREQERILELLREHGA